MNATLIATTTERIIGEQLLDHRARVVSAGTPIRVAEDADLLGTFTASCRVRGYGVRVRVTADQVRVA